MPLDLSLNVAWLLLGLLAIGMTLGVSSRRKGSKGWKLAGIVLVLAALFPFISATDDILRVERFATQDDAGRQDSRDHGQRSHRTSTGDDVVRLYEVMDSPLVPHVSGVSFVALFVSFITVPTATTSTRVAPHASGRSPPAPFFASL